MVCQQKCSYMYLFLTIMPLGFQFNHPMDGSGFFIGGCGGFGGGAQMSGSTPQADGSQNQPTNKQNQSSSQMQQQLIQIGEHNYPSVTIKLKTLRCTCIQWCMFPSCNVSSHSSAESCHFDGKGHCSGFVTVLQHRGCAPPAGSAETSVWSARWERRHVRLFHISDLLMS